MGLRDRVVAWLAQDQQAEPQARDERPIATSRTEHTEEPERDNIERWRDEYEANPLIRQPIRNFASDVLEPGVAPRVDVPDDADMPTVPQDYPLEAYRGLNLDDALGKWLDSAAIADGGQFQRSVADLMVGVLKDLRGRRGAAIIEHAYDDPAERQFILGLRAFKPETTTAYTREGKAILLRPDDDPTGDQFETKAIRTIAGDSARDGAPDTPAGLTAAFVQYDDIFGRYNERSDIPLALDDVTFLTNDADTGAIFGKPDTASVVDESEQLRDEWSTLGDAITLTAVGNWIAKVDTNDPDEARDLLSNVDPEDGDKPLSVVNYEVDLEQAFGDYPNVTDTIQQQIEYILAALPTPLYRVGFAGDINRDITTEQRQDYRDEIRRERDRLESAFHALIHQKAKEFLFNDCKADQPLPDGIDVGIEIRPEESDSPLEDEAFDADDFASMMQGVSAAVGTGGARQVIPVHELRETVLGLPAEPPDPPEGGVDAPTALPDETDEQVQAAFRDAYLATRYNEGDPVVQAGGTRGVVVEVRQSDFELDGTEYTASASSPAYVVATENGSRVARASELTKEDWTTDVGPDEPLDGVQEAEASIDGEVTREAVLARTTGHLGHASWSMPDSWQESETPARLILLKAWAAMGGSFDGCQREMQGAIRSTEEFCASMKDEVLGTHDWRKGG